MGLTATSTARGPLSPSPLPTPRPIPRLTPTCFTVDTTDIPTLTGATMDILTSTANKSKSENSILHPPPSALPGGALKHKDDLNNLMDASSYSSLQTFASDG